MYHYSCALSIHRPITWGLDSPCILNGDRNSRNKHGGTFEAAGP